MTKFETEIENIVDAILEDYTHDRDIDRIDLFKQPDKDVIIDMIDKLRRIVFPGYFTEKTYRMYTAKHNLSMLIEDVMFNLNRQVELVVRDKQEAERVCLAFFREIPKIRALVQTDLQAAYDGDPAASGKEEIIFSYPGLFAITVYRLANVLYRMKVPMIPRIMTEYAHSVTGIDIHPGATIGEYFFIDHGTGIVIGETTVIGNGVKIYQGVTLGALSTRGGQNLHGKRRHPTIEDNVTIYAGASILGGNTVIGKNSVIGSNVFITESIGPETKVTTKCQELEIRVKK